MNKQVVLSLATAASALATAALAVAEEIGNTTPAVVELKSTTAAGEVETETETPKRRGRPAGSTNTTPAETPAPAAATTGKTYEELRDIIKPLVEDGKGEEVKKVITKYGTGLKDIPADKHAAFEKDIAALSY